VYSILQDHFSLLLLKKVAQLLIQKELSYVCGGLTIPPFYTLSVVEPSRLAYIPSPSQTTVECSFAVGAVDQCMCLKLGSLLFLLLYSDNCIEYILMR
jgi:hypothetical protein